MDQSVYSSLLLAFTYISDPITAHSSRIEATSYIEQFKQRDDAMSYLQYIISTDLPEHSIVIKFGAMTILENWIFLWWNKITLDQQMTLRAGIMNMYSNAVLFENAKEMRSKIASLISGLAKRQYPQNWPTFLEDMTECLARCGDSNSPINSFADVQAHISIVAITYMIEDCIDSDFNTSMPNIRRQDVLSGIKNHMSSLLRSAYTFLCQSATRYTSSVASATRSTESAYHGAQGASLTNVTFKLLTSLVVLAKADDLCQPSCDFSVVAFQCIPVGNPLQKEALAFLSALAHTKLPGEMVLQYMVRMPTFCPLFFPPVQQAGDLDDEFLERQNIFSSLCFSLLSVNTGTAFDMNVMSKAYHSAASTSSLLDIPSRETLSTDASSYSTGILQPYMQMLVNVLNSSSSRRLAVEALNNIHKIIKDDAFLAVIGASGGHVAASISPAHSWIPSMCMCVLQAFMVKIKSVRWSGGGVIDDDTAELEFDTKEDYVEFQGQFRSHYHLFCGTLASKFPVLCVAVLNVSLKTLMSAFTTHTLDYGTKTPITGGSSVTVMSTCSSTYIEWAAFSSTLCACIPKLSSFVHGGQVPRQSFTSDLRASLTELLDIMCMQWPMLAAPLQKESLLVVEYVKCLEGLGPILGLNATYIQATFSFLFGTMLYNDPVSLVVNAMATVVAGSAAAAAGTGNRLVSDGTFQCRRRAAGAIANLSVICCDDLISSNLLLELCTQANGLLQSGQLLHTQRVSMVETLVSMSEKVDGNPAIKQQILETAFGNTIKTLTSGETCSMLSSPFSLLHAMTQCTSPNESTTLPGTKDLVYKEGDFSSLLHHLAVLAAACRKVNVPDALASSWIRKEVPGTFADITNTSLECIWGSVFPVVMQAMSLLHALFTPEVRARLMIACDGSRGETAYILPVKNLRALLVSQKSNKAQDAPAEEEERTLLELQGLAPVPSEAEVAKEIELYNVLWELKQNIYSVFVIACKHKYLYLKYAPSVGPANQLVENGWWSQLGSVSVEYMDYSHLTTFIKQCLVSVVMESPDCAHSSVKAFLGPFMASMWRRLSGSVAINSENNDFPLQSCLSSAENLSRFVFADCSINAQQYRQHYQNQSNIGSSELLSNESLGNIRQSIFFDFTRNFGDALATFCACKGSLSTLTPTHASTISPKHASTSRPDPDPLAHSIAMEGKVRKELILMLLLADENTYVPFMHSVLFMLSVPDLATCRRALQILCQLSDFSISLSFALSSMTTYAQQLIPPIANNAFEVILSHLLSEKECYAGLENEFVDFLQVSYGRYVLNVNEEGASCAIPGGSTALSITSQKTTVNDLPSLCTSPRTILLEKLQIPAQELSQMDQNMLSVHQSKRKRRDVFKEVLKAAFAARKSGDVMSSSNGNGKIKDLPGSVARDRSKAIPKVKSSQEMWSLESLFSAED